MVKISKALMFKRVLVFLIGLFLAALGVAVHCEGVVGVAPVASAVQVRVCCEVLPEVSPVESWARMRRASMAAVRASSSAVEGISD